MTREREEVTKQEYLTKWDILLSPWSYPRSPREFEVHRYETCFKSPASNQVGQLFYYVAKLSLLKAMNFNIPRST